MKTPPRPLAIATLLLAITACSQPIAVDQAHNPQGPKPHPPNISGVAVSETNTTDATIVWATDQLADSTAQWGTSTAYGLSVKSAVLVTSHTLSISNLSPSTLYHYRVSSTNATGQGSISADNTFTTLTPVSPPPDAACALTNGLAGYWSFDNNYSDGSGLGQTLTPNGSAYFGRGYIFSGLADDNGGYASLADNATVGLGGDASFSISVWVNPSGLGDYRAIVDKGAVYDGVHDTYLLGLDDTFRFRFVMGDGAGGHAAAVTDATVGTPSLQTWYCLVAVYEAPSHQMNLWVNGASNTPVAWPYGTVRNAGNFTVGANSEGGFAWPGVIDEVVVWTNRALGGAEIRQIYTNGMQGLTPLTYCSAAAGRTTVFFSGDARFSRAGSETNMPDYFSQLSWVSNHNATVVNCSGGVPPGYCMVEQMEEWTNQFATVMAYAGPHTNLIFVGQVGINNEYIMTNGPLYGYWTGPTIALQLTNYLQTLVAAGVKVVQTTTYPQIGLEFEGGDGSLANAEEVRRFVNQATTNFFPHLFGGLDVDLFSPTNHSPMYWGGGNPSEMNDIGNTNVAANLNTLLNAIAP